MTRWLIPFAVAFASSTAGATPHDLPFSYPYATLADGALEIEQYVDLTPVPVINFGGSGGFACGPGTCVTTLHAVATTEVEYGLTDRLEAGFYFEGSNNTLATDGTIPAQIDGIGQRLRYRFADEGVLPIDLSVYGEVFELVNELELEGKINLEKRLGRLLLIANLWAEREIYYAGQQEWVLNPTAGATFEVTTWIHLGLEYWGHGEYGGTTNAGNPGLSPAATAFNPFFHSYLGPAVLLQTGRVWLSAAPYVRLDNWGRTAQWGDQYGPIWVRTILGLEF